MRLRILALEEGWRILFAGSPDEALRLCTGTRSVLIYDHDLSGVDWRCGLRLLAADQPVIPIVIAQSPSARLRSDVLDCGGYDLACNPLDAESFVLLVKSALALAEAIDSAVPEM
jgi:DNA-binding NarL/FixJ family response regulator